MYAAMQQPADIARVAEYGDIAQIPGKMYVRPARVVVGQAFGADVVNEAVAPIQQQVIETLGLRGLASKLIDEMA